jgi:hypothetical protein
MSEHSRYVTDYDRRQEQFANDLRILANSMRAAMDSDGAVVVGDVRCYSMRQYLEATREEDERHSHA